MRVLWIYKGTTATRDLSFFEDVVRRSCDKRHRKLLLDRCLNNAELITTTKWISHVRLLIRKNRQIEGFNVPHQPSSGRRIAARDSRAGEEDWTKRKKQNKTRDRADK